MAIASAHAALLYPSRAQKSGRLTEPPRRAWMHKCRKAHGCASATLKKKRAPEGARHSTITNFELKNVTALVVQREVETFRLLLVADAQTHDHINDLEKDEADNSRV